MKAETPLDYAVFQLSPKRSRCELFVSSNGNTERLASGLVKPFVTHLKVAEEQVALAVPSIKLEVQKRRNAETWFTKGTLERFVRFVSTPEVLELVNTFDAEMSQLEAARRIYSQVGVGDQLSGASGGDGPGTIAAADATKKELLRAMDVRLVAVRQDLTTACARASAAGFNPETVSELQLFADRFGAHRLNEACSEFKSVCQRRPDLINHHHHNHSWKTPPVVDDRAVRSSTGSDMSIDDPTEDHLPGSHQQPQQESHNPNLSSTCQPPNSSSSSSSSSTNITTSTTTFPLRRAQDEKDDDFTQDPHVVAVVVGVEENKKKEVTESSTPPLTIQQQQPTRRLSVQDRINLFENKQKENSGGKPAAAAVVVVAGKSSSSELRRLSSDVSSLSSSSSAAAAAAATAAAAASEKAVLRRWSGASDMSIDLSGERKDVDNSSPLCTPSSSSVVSLNKSGAFSGVSVDKDRHSLNDTATSSKAEVKSIGLKDQAADSQTRAGVVSSGKEEEEVGVGSKAQQTSWKDQASSTQNQFRFFPGKEEQVGLNQNDQAASLEKLKIVSGGEERGRIKEQSEFPNRVGEVGLGDQPVIRSRIGLSLKTTAEVESKNWNSLVPEKLESFMGLKVQESLPVQNQEVDSLEDSETQKMKFKRQGIAHDQLKKSQGRRDESNSTFGSGSGSRKPVFPGKKVSESEESYDSISMPPVEQVQRVRQSKGNQELNDELKLKANELEKLFAEHKLRAPGDQSTSSRRSKPADMQMDQESDFSYKASSEMTPEQLPVKSMVPEPSSSNIQTFTSSSVMKTPDSREYGNAMKQNFSELSFSDDSRGKFYEKYMQKRDAKMREEWGSKRAEKEAKMKAMQDSLERSRAELKARFAWSADRQDSVSSARRRAEKLRSFNFRSNMKREQPIDYVQSEEEEDISDLREQKPYGQDRMFSETSIVDGASRTTQVRKLLPGRNLPSSTPRTSLTPVPRSSVKASNSSAGRRRAQSENPLAQSVPNFSDFRKENTKPTSAVSKTTPRLQVRNYARSKSSSEDVSSSKEEKPRRSHSLRKSSAAPVEFKETLSNSDGIVFTPMKFDEPSDQSLYDKFSKNVESKPFLRKGNGIGPGAGASVAKLKASMASESLINEEESDEMAFEPEDSVDLVKEEEGEEEEEFEVAAEDFVHMDNGKPSPSQESDKSGNSGSENGDAIRSPSPVDPASVAELPAAVPSVFHALGLQDSPGESPMSWNSRMHHSFSYPHEISDVDASVDSPMGSPASWNSHSLAQAEADAARMRKKWGSAYKPVIVANSSHNQSRKDMTKGFKRLLKFGRKSRGTESLADWISATTSEGDDDTEDGRDPANRSSDDLRKSRMGFSQNPSDDGFNESELYNEQVQALHSSIPAPPANFKLREDHLSGSSLKAPRSFFSLSSFRSKGSDSKPR